MFEIVLKLTQGDFLLLQKYNEFKSIVCTKIYPKQLLRVLKNMECYSNFIFVIHLLVNVELGKI